jgi:rhomboid protease GluP
MMNDKKSSNKISHSNPADEIDEYDFYNNENTIQDNSDLNKRFQRPLSHRPSFSSSYPALLFSIFIIFFSEILGNTQYAELLLVSRESIYKNHEFWRLCTALFMHSDGLHLISNLPLLILFGTFLYEYFGFMAFPVIPLIIGLISNGFTIIFYQDSIHLLGASGMIYGMVSLWLVLYIYHDTDHSIMMRIFRSTGFTLIMLFPETYNPSTSYLAHASGFTTGLISGILILPFIKLKKR